MPLNKETKPSNCQSSSVSVRMECCKSLDLFVFRAIDCSVHRIPSLSIMGRHPEVASLGRGVYLSADVQLARSVTPADTADMCMWCTNFWIAANSFYVKLGG